MKKAFKLLVGKISALPVFEEQITRSASRSINIVYYHYAGNPRPHYKSFYDGCTTNKLEEDLRRLKRTFTFASLSDVLAEHKGNRRGRPLLAVTFDDGLNLKTDGAVEVLQRMGVRATTFVITSCVGNQSMMWRHILSCILASVDTDRLRLEFDRLAKERGLSTMGFSKGLLSVSREWPVNEKDHLARDLWKRCGLNPLEAYLSDNKPYFDWQDLHEWTESGHSVGFHTHTHPFCSRLREADLEGEIFRPSVSLKERLGLSEIYFSYPFGDRLRPDTEKKLRAKNVFAMEFGIDGFSKIGESVRFLERASAEGSLFHWNVFGRHLLNRP